MSEPALLETVVLSDGRSLSFARLGDPEGRPVFYFHGFPGSRFESQSNHEEYFKAGIQLLALDRLEWVIQREKNSDAFWIGPTTFLK